MRLDLNNFFNEIVIIVIGFAFLLISMMGSQAASTAVIPHQIIYPGQKISRQMVREVDVINPNLRPGYAKIIAEVDGLVTKKTLLPGRIIPVSVLRKAYTIERGKNISMVLSNNAMLITAQGVALQNGSLGEVISARNLDSGIIISGTVMPDGSLQVTNQ